MAGTTFYLPCEVAPSSRERKSGQVTPARMYHPTDRPDCPHPIPGDRSVQFQSTGGNWLRQVSLSPFRRGKATDFGAERITLYQGSVKPCVFSGGV